MRRLCIVFAGLVALASAASAPADPPAEAVHYYVALGDSLATGQQLDRNENFGEGYADKLYALERTRTPSLTLVKLGCSGETTSSMIVPVPVVPQGLYEGRGARFFCDFPGDNPSDARVHDSDARQRAARRRRSDGVGRIGPRRWPISAGTTSRFVLTEDPLGATFSRRLRRGRLANHLP